MMTTPSASYSAQDIIDQLKLDPLPEEGGYFRRIFTHPHRCPQEALPESFRWSREMASGIFYLVTRDSYSALHRLPCVETFHFHCGDPLEMLQLHADGSGSIHRIGVDFAAGESPFLVVPQDVWQGSRLARIHEPRHGYAFFSIMVMPGFDWEDFELGSRAKLVKDYPEWKAEIEGLTR